MADPRFKVRRQAYFKRGITSASKITVDGGINTTAGSVSTFSGGLTAASTFTSSTSAIFGSGGTPIAGILCGSGAIKLDGVATSVASATCFTVAGLTTSHKIFLTAACISACLTTACVYANPATPTELVVTFLNQSTEAQGAGTSTVWYLAVLDK